MNLKHNKKAVVFIASEQKSFLAHVANLLLFKYNYDVTIAARDKYVIKFVKDFLPDLKAKFIDLSGVSYQIDTKDLLNEARNIEKRYNKTLSILMSEDRALGQGYLSNVQGVPHIIRSLWPHEAKLFELISEFKKKESIIKNTDLVIQLAVTNENYIICSRLFFVEIEKC